MRCEKTYEIVHNSFEELKKENPEATLEDLSLKVAERLGCLRPSASKLSRILGHWDFCKKYSLPIGNVSEGALRLIHSLGPEDLEKAVTLLKAQISLKPENVVTGPDLAEILADVGISLGEAELIPEAEAPEPEMPSVYCLDFDSKEAGLLENVAGQSHMQPEDWIKMIVKQHFVEKGLL